jgi:hypothetical protein
LLRDANVDRWLVTAQDTPFSLPQWFPLKGEVSMPDSPTATRINAAEASATVLSDTPAVTAWALRYFGPWWNAVDAPPTGGYDIANGPVVIAEVDLRRLVDLAARVTGSSHEQTVYARAPILVARGDDGSVHALSPTEELVYRTEPGSGQILIAGAHEQPISTAAARLAREAVRAMLHRDGGILLHASAVSHDGHAVLAFGDKGAGKTTTALLLARRIRHPRPILRDRSRTARVPAPLRGDPWPRHHRQHRRAQ